MEIVDYLLARKKAGGGGSDVTIEQLSVTENGTYSEEGIAYSPVVVNVPAPENSYQLKDLPTGTVSTIEDGTNLPMSSLKVGIEQVQDLHGYDHPWAGGAGKNLLEVTATTQTLNGVTFTVNTDGTVNISGTATAGVLLILNTMTLPEGNYIVSGGINNNCYINVEGKANSYGADNSFSVASGGETLNVRVYIVSGTTVSGTFKPMIRLATETDATFEPYSNICPISGWTEANVSVSPTTSAEDGTTYNIQFKDGDNPLTVYGGTLDVTTGELVVTKGYVFFDGSNDEEWILFNNPDFNVNQLYVNISNVVSSAGISGGNTLCDKFKSISIDNRNGNYNTCYAGRNGICFNIKDFTVEMWRNWLTDNNVAVTYTFETPTTYQLTPTQVRTLVGTNNIWADTGDIISGKYFKSLT